MSGYYLDYFLTYVLTPWSRVLLEKLIGSAASQKFPPIFGTRMFLTVPTSVRHLSLSWAKSIQSPQLPPTSWRSILILSSHLRLGLPNGLFPSGYIILLYNIIILWEHRHICGPSLTETSLCGSWPNFTQQKLSLVQMVKMFLIV